MTDHDQFMKVFVAHQHRIFRFICSLVPGRADAEELFQETALVLWQRWSEFDASREFLPWAFGIAMNMVRNWRRKQTRRGPLLSLDTLEQLAETRLHDSANWDRLHAVLELCLQKLPPEQRALLDECYGRGVSIRDVAEHAERSPNVVYKLLAKIRQTLHRCVQSHVELDAGPAHGGAL